jgi:hypothetical protein
VGEGEGLTFGGKIPCTGPGLILLLHPSHTSVIRVAKMDEMLNLLVISGLET